jgi:hypothetical protein
LVSTPLLPNVSNTEILWTGISYIIHEMFKRGLIVRTKSVNLFFSPTRRGPVFLRLSWLCPKNTFYVQICCFKHADAAKHITVKRSEGTTIWLHAPILIRQGQVGEIQLSQTFSTIYVLTHVNPSL